MRPEYVDLRAAIYCDEKELRRFRQVIVNCVMATDLHDSDLQMVRKARWAKAFSADDRSTFGTAEQGRRRPMRRAKGIVGKQKDIAPTPSGGGMLAALREAANDASRNLLRRPKDMVNRKGQCLVFHGDRVHLI